MLIMPFFSFTRMDINATGSASARQGHHNQEGNPIEHHFDPQGYQFMYPND